jgi:hypothetical protein
MAIIENGAKIKSENIWDVTTLDDTTCVASMTSNHYVGGIEDGNSVNVVVEYWSDEAKFVVAVQVFDEYGRYLDNDNDTIHNYVTDDELKEVKKDLFQLANSEG